MKQKEDLMNVLLKLGAHFYSFIFNIVLLLFFIGLGGKVNGNTNN